MHKKVIHSLRPEQKAVFWPGSADARGLVKGLLSTGVPIASYAMKQGLVVLPWQESSEKQRYPVLWQAQ